VIDTSRASPTIVGEIDVIDASCVGSGEGSGDGDGEGCGWGSGDGCGCEPPESSPRSIV
jgi:hypothetical protein